MNEPPMTEGEITSKVRGPTVERIEGVIYHDLRDDIIQLSRRPGDRLLLEDLGRYYGTSLTPIRQALRRLEGDGLVSMAPGRGSTVAQVTFDELEEIVAIRMGVEPLLARLGAIQVTAREIEQMERHMADSDEALSRGDAAGCFDARARSRDVCYVAADRPRLLVIAQHQRMRTKRYLFSIAGSEDALLGAADLHRMLLEACRTHDGALAALSTYNALAAALMAIGPMLDAKRTSDWQWLGEEGSGRAADRSDGDEV